MVVKVRVNIFYVWLDTWNYAIYEFLIFSIIWRKINTLESQNFETLLGLYHVNLQGMVNLYLLPVSA